MITTADKPAINIAKICASLDALPSGRRYQDDHHIQQVIPSVRAARARRVPWPVIVADLARSEIRTSVKRLKALLADDTTPTPENLLGGGLEAPINGDINAFAPDAVGGAA